MRPAVGRALHEHFRRQGGSHRFGLHNSNTETVDERLDALNLFSMRFEAPEVGSQYQQPIVRPGRNLLGSLLASLCFQKILQPPKY
jgi:hypothetical protein